MKKLCLLIIIALNIAAATAQDCKSIYQGGLDVFRRRTSSTIQDAIKRFEAAKRCYELMQDAAGVQQCEQKISEANTALAALNPGMKLSRNELSFPSDGGTESITVTAAANVNWSPASAPDWIKAEKTDRSAFSITAAPNTSVAARSHNVAILYGSNREVLVRVSQAAAEPSIAISRDSIRFSAAIGLTELVDVTSNVDWTISGIPDWCKERTSKDLLTLTLEPNDGADDRSAAISITAGSKTIELHISQANDHITFDPTQLNFKASVPRAQKFITGNEKQTVKIIYAGDMPVPFEVTDKPEWCAVKKIDDRTLEVECTAANKEDRGRNGTILLRKRSADISIPVYQAGKK